MKAIIYCDETGSNGGNLLDASQPYFAYGSFIMNDEQIKKISSYLKLNTENEEKRRGIKFDVLCQLMNDNDIRGQVYIADKKLTLCCNIFEWVIEEVLYHNNIDNSFWYTNNLHKGLANMLYIYTIVNDKSVIWLLDKLNSCLETGGEKRAKKQQTSEKELLECNLGDFQDNPLCYAIIRLFQKYNHIIPIRKHQLDPSFTSLFANISHLTQQYNISECEIYYDESKSIFHSEEFLKKVGEKRKLISHRNDLKISIPKINHIEQVKSESNIGVIIADILLYKIAKEFAPNRKNILDLKTISFDGILPENSEDMQNMIDKINILDLKTISFDGILPENSEDMQNMIDKMHQYNIIPFLLSL